ncbi:hypothetical protein [Staphylococcus kloosii]|jgi:hypothetical protein|uniref:hypothetical protein n=1 Tax=Staphylococcus kloosii TaxID=29384 RepID=UPI00189F4FB1|nr:hypothetical protein [Staphylococcus kloosii]MBF7023646.1 hypothetical protein [Staphylococcus kloosii]
MTKQFEIILTNKNITPSMNVRKYINLDHEIHNKPICLFYPCGRGSKLLINFYRSPLFTREGFEHVKSYIEWQRMSEDVRKGSRIVYVDPYQLGTNTIKAKELQYFQFYVKGDEVFCREVLKDLNYMWETDKEKYFEVS